MKKCLVLGLLLGGGSVGIAQDFTTPNEARIPCTAPFDMCTQTRRVDVGSGRAQLNSQGYVSGTIDAYHDGALDDCGWAYEDDLVTSLQLPGNTSFVFLLGNFHVFNDQRAGGDGFTFDEGVKIRLAVGTHNSSNCTGAQVAYASDEVIRYGNYAGEAEACFADSKADCAGAFGDPANVCHQVDVAAVAQPSGTTKSYKIYLKLFSCDGNGANCVQRAADTGCLAISS